MKQSSTFWPLGADISKTNICKLHAQHICGFTTSLSTVTPRDCQLSRVLRASGGSHTPSRTAAPGSSFRCPLLKCEMLTLQQHWLGPVPSHPFSRTLPQPGSHASRLTLDFLPNSKEEQLEYICLCVCACMGGEEHPMSKLAGGMILTTFTISWWSLKETNNKTKQK